MGRKKVVAAVVEGPLEVRARLVAELRLFGHKESADLLEADGLGILGLGIEMFYLTDLTTERKKTHDDV